MRSGGFCPKGGTSRRVSEKNSIESLLSERAASELVEPGLGDGFTVLRFGSYSSPGPFWFHQTQLMQTTQWEAVREFVTILIFEGKIAPDEHRE